YAHGSITGCRIGNGGDDTAVHKAVLLLHTVPMRHANLDAAGAHRRKARLDQRHGVLSGKAGADTFVKRGVFSVFWNGRSGRMNVQCVSPLVGPDATMITAGAA